MSDTPFMRPAELAHPSLMGTGSRVPDTPRVLACWDGSANAERAVSIAVDLTRRLAGELDLLLVWDYLTQPNDRRLEYHHEDALRDVTAAAARLIPTDVPCRVYEELGLATEVIPRFASDHANLLVVIGRSGRGGVLGHVFGTTTSNVLRRCHTPVVVVPPTV